MYLFEEGELEEVPPLKLLWGSQACGLCRRFGGGKAEEGLQKVILKVPRLIEQCHVDVLYRGLKQLEVLSQVWVGVYQSFQSFLAWCQLHSTFGRLRLRTCPACQLILEVPERLHELI